jgi:hypothetical protein
MKRILILSLALFAAVLTACASTPTTQEACAAVDQVHDAINLTHLASPAAGNLQLTSIQLQLMNSWMTLMSTADRLDNERVDAQLAAANEVIVSIPAITGETADVVAVESIERQAAAASEGIAPLVEYCLTAQ